MNRNGTLSKSRKRSKADPTTTPAQAPPACETCGKPCTLVSGDGHLYCDPCAPPMELGEELFNALFSPCLKGRLNPGLWSVILSTLWGETETGVLDLYETRVGKDLTTDEARAYIDGTRAVAASLTRVCDVAELVLEHGAETVMKVPTTRREPEPVSPPPLLRPLDEAFADLNDFLAGYDRGEAEERAYAEVLHALTWARSRNANGHALANLVSSLAALFAARTADIESSHEGLTTGKAHPLSVNQFKMTAQLAALVNELAQHLAAETERRGVRNGNEEFPLCNLDWMVAG